MTTTTNREFTVTITITDTEAEIIAEALAKGIAAICTEREDLCKTYYDYITPAKELRDTIGGLVNIAYIGVK